MKVFDLLEVIRANRVTVREVRCYVGGRCEIDVLADFGVSEDGCEDESVLNRDVSICFACDDDPDHFVINVMRKEVA